MDLPHSDLPTEQTDGGNLNFGIFFMLDSKTKPKRGRGKKIFESIGYSSGW